MNGPVGLYIHIPFCASHCAYCHFVIDLDRGEIQKRYTDALLQEIRTGSHTLLHEKTKVDTVYIGGGTPSWIPPQFIRQILQTIRESVEVIETPEITIEANPDSIEDEKIRLYAEAGINRVSLGVQSFHEEELKRLGRTHSVEDVLGAIGRLRKGGFHNISIDLIAGLPGQTTTRWKRNFEFIRKLLPEHVSLYLFDVDEESLLGRKTLRSSSQSDRGTSPGKQTPHSLLPGEDEIVDIYREAIRSLTDLGYEQYEISNFARRAGECGSWQSRHNLKYWRMQSYWGVGCAAHSFLSSRRWHNENSTEGYIQAMTEEGDARREMEEIDASRLAEDAFIFGLRQMRGVSYDSLDRLLNCESRKLFRQVIEPCIADGWLVEDAVSLRLSPNAILVSNEIFERFLGAGGGS